jgi:hypothetical protein
MKILMVLLFITTGVVFGETVFYKDAMSDAVCMVSDFTAGDGFIKAKVVRVKEKTSEYTKMFTGIFYISSKDYNGNMVYEGCMHFIMLDAKGNVSESMEIYGPNVILSGDKLVLNYEMLLTKLQRIFIKKKD